MPTEWSTAVIEALLHALTACGFRRLGDYNHFFIGGPDVGPTSGGNSKCWGALPPM